MDPTLVLGKAAIDYTTGKLMDKIVSRFHVDVIQRWTKHRAETFFQVFCQEVAQELFSQNTSANVDVLLEMILESDVRSEVLFDSYRRVCMTRSKDLGPRIIGVLTAQLIAQEDLASHTEEMIFMAAEQLNDDEFLAFAEFYEENKKLAETSEKKKKVRLDKWGDLEINWCAEQVDSSWNKDTNISLAPLNLGECLGSWALKLKPLGFVSDDVRERQWEYEEDTERHIDEAGSVREVSWWIKIPSSSLQLVELIRRSSFQSTI